MPWPFKKKDLSAAPGGGYNHGSWFSIFDWRPHAWQTHHAYDTGETSVLAHPIVFACITLISGDVGKLPFIVEQRDGNVWKKVEHDILKLLRKPNKYQNEIQFKKQWMLSKLIHGNAYILKIREGREVVGLLALDPAKVLPLISEMGEVFYQLSEDDLTGIEEQTVVPSTEIIHDRDNCLYSPIVGLSPLFAGAESARTGNSIIKDSKGFFGNGANPGGVLTAPGEISEETASRLKEYWQGEFSGNNAGKVAVLGDGLKYEPMRMTSVDAQLIEQLGWSDEKICSVFHVPAYKVGVGPAPTYNNIDALTVDYYQSCLQDLVQSMECGLNMGLNHQPQFRIQLDENALFRMDQATLTKSLNDSVGGGWMSPDEARERVNLPPVPGGEYPYLQQQNYSLEALAKRDADDPFAMPEPANDEPPVDQEMMLKGMAAQFREALTA